MICCGGLPEYEFIRDNFGYKNSVAKYTGLARFDNLHNHINENCILIMPTWRRTLDGVDEESFVSSLYFAQWTMLLKMIIDAVPTDFQIYYYVHHKMNKYVHLFREDFSNISFIVALFIPAVPKSLVFVNNSTNSPSTNFAICGRGIAFVPSAPPKSLYICQHSSRSAP